MKKLFYISIDKKNTYYDSSVYTGINIIKLLKKTGFYKLTISDKYVKGYRKLLFLKKINDFGVISKIYYYKGKRFEFCNKYLEGFDGNIYFKVTPILLKFEDQKFVERK